MKREEVINIIYQQDDKTFVVEGNKEFVEAVTHLAETIDKNIEIDIRSTGIAFEFDDCRYTKDIVELLINGEQYCGARTKGDTK